MTIRLVILLFEGLTQHLCTVSAGEMIRMKLSKHGCCAFADYWLPTNGAQ